jgi:hypothetical protein
MIERRTGEVNAGPSGLKGISRLIHALTGMAIKLPALRACEAH